MGRATADPRGRMIFAFGLPRSGTFWLQRIITAHPAVAEIPAETHLFERAIAPLLENFHHGVKASPSIEAVYADREALIAAVRDMCDTVFGAHLVPGAERVSERSPRHVNYVDLIAEIYPDAHCVHVIRDPRDVARSVLSHEWGPNDAGEAAAEWVAGIEAARAGAAPLYRELRYEDLLTDLEGSVRNLYGWLKLDASETIVRRSVAAAEVHVNRDPAGTGAGSGKWRTMLDPAQITAVEAAAGDLMDELGYERASQEASVAAPSPAVGRSPNHGGRLRTLAQRVRRRERESMPGPVAAAAAFDDLIAALQARDIPALRDLLTDDATVRVMREEDDVLCQGSAGVDLLEEELSSDVAFSAPQLRGTVHNTYPGFVGVFGYSVGTGAVAQRLVVASCRGERFAYLTLQRI